MTNQNRVIKELANKRFIYLESIITPSRVHVTEELGQPLNENIDDLSVNVKKKLRLSWHNLVISLCYSFVGTRA